MNKELILELHNCLSESFDQAIKKEMEILS